MSVWFVAGPTGPGRCHGMALEALERLLLQMGRERSAAWPEPCTGQGPRCWSLRLDSGVNSSRARTWAMVTVALMAAKSMAGRAAAAGACWAARPPAGFAAAVCGARGPRPVCGRGRRRSPGHVRRVYLWSDVAYGTMQADGVIAFDVIADGATGIFQRQRRLLADAVPLEGAMEAFDLAVGLRIIGGGLTWSCRRPG